MEYTQGSVSKWRDLMEGTEIRERKNPAGVGKQIYGAEMPENYKLTRATGMKWKRLALIREDPQEST